MDALSIIKLIPSLISASTMIQGLISQVKSNEDLITKVSTAFPTLANILQYVGESLFPQVNPQLQQAAAVVRLYGSDFTKTAQQFLNIVSPLLGLPNPALDVDGIAGPLTTAATLAAQEKLKAYTKDLVADGFFGFKTLAAVQSFLASLTPPK